MGAASKLAAKHGKIACDDCKKPFGPERRIASFSDEPLEAICQWCDLKRTYYRDPSVHRLCVERAAMLEIMRGFSKMHSGLPGGDARAPTLSDSMARTAQAVIETFDARALGEHTP